MSDPTPLVTIAIPVFNGKSLLRNAIESALNSFYPNLELLIVDDASTDHSVMTIESIDDPRIRLLRNETNQGLVAARNRLLTEAHGEFIAWLDQDDIAYPTRLRVQAEYLSHHPKVAACGSFVGIRNHLDDGSEQIRTRRFPTRYEEVRAQIVFGNPINFSTAMMSNRLIHESGINFREEFGNTLDYDLWSRISERLAITNIPQVLGEYRVHGEQTSRGDALSIMDRQAWRVQREALERDLGISVEESTEHIHFKMCFDRARFTDADDLLRASEWIGKLKSANSERETFRDSAFERVLARQWIGLVSHLRSRAKKGLDLRMISAALASTGIRRTVIASSLSREFAIKFLDR